MKAVFLAGIVLMAMGAIGGAQAAQTHPAQAAESQYDDIVILSVIPRSPDVKPFFLSVPADGHEDKAAATVKPASFEPTPQKH